VVTKLATGLLNQVNATPREIKSKKNFRRSFAYLATLLLFVTCDHRARQDLFFSQTVIIGRAEAVMVLALLPGGNLDSVNEYKGLVHTASMTNSTNARSMQTLSGFKNFLGVNSIE
jgi:hypothetical protein